MPSVLVAVLGCPPTPIWSSHFASSQDPTGRNRARSSPLRQATIFAASPDRPHSLSHSLPTPFDLEHFRPIRHSGYTAYTPRAPDVRHRGWSQQCPALGSFLLARWQISREWAMI